MNALRKHADDAVSDIIEADAFSKKTYESYSNFRKMVSGWSDIGEKVYFSDIAGS